MGTSTPTTGKGASTVISEASKRVHNNLSSQSKGQLELSEIWWMKAVTSPGRHERHPPLPKLTMGRARTRSRNDSGFEDEFGTPDWTSSCLEDTIQTWVARLEGERVREATEVAKQEMKPAGEDVKSRDAALLN